MVAREPKVPYTPRHSAAPLSGGDAIRFTAQVIIAGLVTAVCTTTLSLFSWTLLPFAVGWSPSVVLTGSMLPAIEPGDIVVTGDIDGVTLQPGHVIRFVDPSRPERFLLHRITQVNDNGTFVTRGDANGSEDSTPVPPANVVGVARLRVPIVGLPVVWLREGEYLSLGLTAAGVIVAVQVMAGVRSSFREPDAEDDAVPQETTGVGPDPHDPEDVEVRAAEPTVEGDAVVAAGPADDGDRGTRVRAASPEADAIEVVFVQAAQLMDVAVQARQLRPAVPGAVTEREPVGADA